jgi:5-formyltetrahydrofolate cyclo-ligase
MTQLSLPEWGGRNEEKDRLRSHIWELLKTQKAAIRDPVGHIPNFVGAEQAAERLVALPLWQRAKVVKCNPDRPQFPVRLRALEDGKLLYMAVPRLTKSRCFVELNAADLQHQGIALKDAATLRGALIYGKLVTFEEMQPIDLIVTGCVAVTRNGGRTGKGAGFADLELAMMVSFHLVQPDTPIVTTVHELQVVAAEQLPMQAHDWPLDWVITPKEAIATDTLYSRPNGLDWDAIRPDQYRQIPILKHLRDRFTGK